MKKRRWGGRVFATSLLSYVIIMILPICAYVLSLRAFGETINDQSGELNESKLTLLGESMDAKLDKINKGAAEVATNQTQLKYLNPNAAPPYQDYTYVLDTQAQLKRLTDQDRCIETAFIYYRAEDVVISDGTKAAADLFFSVEYSNADTSFEDWKAAIKQIYSREYLYLPGIYEGGNIYVMTPLPVTLAGDKIAATLVVKIYSDTVPRLLEELHMQEDIVYLMDSQGQILYTNQAAAPEGLEEPEYLSSRVVGTDGWQYVSYVHAAQDRERLTALWRTTTMFLAAAALLCLAATIYALRKNYHPLVELTTLLENRVKQYRDKNEYAYLKSSIANLLDSQDENARLLTRQSEQLRTVYVEKLLLGTANLNGRLAESLSVLGLPYESDRFVVIVMGFTPDGAPANEKHPSEGELLGSIFSGYSVDIGGKTAVLADATGLSEQNLHEQARKLYAVMAELSGSLVMAVSRPCTGESGIASAYARTAALLENAMVFGGKRIVLDGDHQPEADAQICFSPEDERLLIDAICVGNEADALAIVRSAWANEVKHISSTLLMPKLLYWDITNALVKAGCAASVDTACLEAMAVQDHVTHAAMLSACEEGVLALCAAVKTQNPSCPQHQDELYGRIIAHIQANYQDADLDIAALCHTFGCSRTALFHLFKQRGESGVLSIINAARMEAAKRLLAQGNSISQTALDVGYLNASSFLRVFKRHEQMTPGQYRDMLRKA